MVADHKDALVVEYYREGKNDVATQSGVAAVQPHCPLCSKKQGGIASAKVYGEENMKNSILDEQKRICDSHGVVCLFPDVNLKIGLAIDSLGEMPITGVRMNPENGTEGWYIWAGDYSDDDDFFKSIHLQHLEELLSGVLNYLALPPGYKFICDDEGYEDVWFDPDLLTG